VGTNGETERIGYFNRRSVELQSRIIGEKLISTKYNGHAMDRDSHSGSQLSIGGKSSWC
jgi:hypothetical protein